MKNILLTISWILLLGFNALGQSTYKGDDIIGVWLSEKRDGKIEIYRSGNKYDGRLIWGKAMFEADGITSKKDVKNGEEKLRTRNLKNLVILTNFTFEDGAWEGGKIYDPESGKTYSCNIRMKGNVLLIRGYIGLSMFGKTTIWSRN
ncbi:MAG: DUF2147 domain-containing protein [Chitinophagales bacterium]|nr:DUF2147 domain-containing protein [Chitinophagales bacterium]